MPIDLHLFSSPGLNGDIRYIVEASRPYLEDRDEPRVAYMPLASLYAERWLEQTAEYFKGLAELDLVNAELMSQPEIEKILRNASLVFIPGGNTFLLNHRLHISKVMPYLKKKVQTGLPLIGFSAGAVVCGPNILTATDLARFASLQRGSDLAIEVRELERLVDVRVGAVERRRHLVQVLADTGEHHHAGVRERDRFPDLATHFPAAHAGHHHVQNDQVRQVLVCEFPGLVAV